MDAVERNSGSQFNIASLSTDILELRTAGIKTWLAEVAWSQSADRG